MKRKISILFLCCGITALLKAQQTENSSNRVSPRELTIPASPVFDLMGVTPSQINRTSEIKDFKVDWSFKSWKLNPNLAIQSQPVWELFYNRKDLAKYQSAPGLLRRLASLDISVGSVQDESNDRRIGFAAKLNLFRQKDPLLATELYEDIGEKYRGEKSELDNQLHALKVKLDTSTSILEKPGIRSQISAVEEQLATQNSRRRNDINGRAKIFVLENWNASTLDIAFGRVYSYKTDSAGGLKSLRLNRNTGYGGWINGSLGIGKKFLFSFLLRNSWYKEELEFQLKNTASGEVTAQKAVAQNTLRTAGVNFRYGGGLFTFFAEFLYEKKGLKTPVEALNDAFKAPSAFQVISSSVKWEVVHPNTLSVGGDWRMSQSVSINYGMRCVFDKNWKFKTFIPVATISCLMR